LKRKCSRKGITDTVVKAIEKGEFDAIIMNYANADMVGHSGKLEAAIKAVEAVDADLEDLSNAEAARWRVDHYGGSWNAETMIDPKTAAAYLSTRQSGSVPSRHGERQVKVAVRRRFARHCAHFARRHRRKVARGHDGQRSANLAVMRIFPARK